MTATFKLPLLLQASTKRKQHLPVSVVNVSCVCFDLAGIKKIALLDFDVHHGNGTQACVGRVVPQIVQYPVATPLCEGSLRFQSFHPWFDEQDSQNILFARYKLQIKQ